MPKPTLRIIANAEAEVRQALQPLRTLLDQDFTLPEILETARRLKMPLAGTNPESLTKELAERYGRYQLNLLDELVFLVRYHTKLVPSTVRTELHQYQEWVNKSQPSFQARVILDQQASQWLLKLPDLVLHSFFGKTKTPELWEKAVLALLCKKWQFDLRSPPPPAA